MPGRILFEVRDEVGGDFEAVVPLLPSPSDHTRIERIDLASDQVYSSPPGVTFLLFVPPAVAPGGTVTLKGNAGDTGQTLANNRPFLLSIPYALTSQTVILTVSSDAGIWTVYAG